MATELKQDLSRELRRSYGIATNTGLSLLVTPEMNFELIYVLVHASVGPIAGNVLTVKVDSGIAAATYDAVLDTQDMNGLVDYAFFPSVPLPFKSDDVISVAYAADYTGIVTFQVAWRSI